MNDVLGWFELIIIETCVVVNYRQRIIYHIFGYIQ